MKILGPNETGKGILIEYDAGYISPKENQRILSEMKDLDFSQDLILFAVLQKYNTPNKNGRIYPEAILKRDYSDVTDLQSRDSSKLILREFIKDFEEYSNDENEQIVLSICP